MSFFDKKGWNAWIGMGVLSFVALLCAYTLFQIFTGQFSEQFKDYKQITYFTMQNCPHCSDFTPLWDNFCKEYGKNTYVILKKEDCTNNWAISKRYGVNKFPTILATDRDGNILAEFNSPRTTQNLIAFLAKVSSM